MSGIADMKQPAREWIADVIANFKGQLDCDEDPVLGFEIYHNDLGLRMEIRLIGYGQHYKGAESC